MDDVDPVLVDDPFGAVDDAVVVTLGIDFKERDGFVEFLVEADDFDGFLFFVSKEVLDRRQTVLLAASGLSKKRRGNRQNEAANKKKRRVPTVGMKKSAFPE